AFASSGASAAKSDQAGTLQVYWTGTDSAICSLPRGDGPAPERRRRTTPGPASSGDVRVGDGRAVGQGQRSRARLPALLPIGRNRDGLRREEEEPVVRRRLRGPRPAHRPRPTPLASRRQRVRRAAAGGVAAPLT